MTKPKQKKEVEYKPISINLNNKQKLEDIKRKLAEHHHKNLRVDVALGHVLSVYSKIKNPERFYKIIKI